MKNHSKRHQKKHASKTAQTNGPKIDSRLSAFSDIVAYIHSGRDVNARDRGGRTPLMALCECDADENDGLNDILETAQVLLERGADVNAEDDDGNDALDYAHNPAVQNFLSNYTIHHHRFIRPKNASKFGYENYLNTVRMPDGVSVVHTESVDSAREVSIFGDKIRYEQKNFLDIVFDEDERARNMSHLSRASLVSCSLIGLALLYVICFPVPLFSVSGVLCCTAITICSVLNIFWVVGFLRELKLKKEGLEEGVGEQIVLRIDNQTGDFGMFLRSGGRMNNDAVKFFHKDEAVPEVKYESAIHGRGWLEVYFQAQAASVPDSEYLSTRRYGYLWSKERCEWARGLILAMREEKSALSGQAPVNTISKI